MAQAVAWRLTQLYWDVPACLPRVSRDLIGLEMGHNYAHTFRISLRWTANFTVIYFFMTDVYFSYFLHDRPNNDLPRSWFFSLSFFLFLYFHSFDWLSFALCIVGGPQRTSDVLAPSWKYCLIANLFFLSISLERIVLYLVDHSCVKLMYHFKDCLTIGSVSLLLSPSKSKDHVAIILIVWTGEIYYCSGSG